MIDSCMCSGTRDPVRASAQLRAWPAGRALVAAVGIWVAGVQGLGGQANDAAADTQASAADSVQLVFEREIFSYPAFERRDPFRPLTGDETSGGPRFEDLVLLGVVISPAPQASVAVVGARPPGATSDEPPNRTFRLRVGETLGNVRVIDVRRREIVVEVADFGARDTRTLALRRALPIVLPTPDPDLAPAPDPGEPSGDPAPAGTPAPDGGAARPSTASQGGRA